MATNARLRCVRRSTLGPGGRLGFRSAGERRFDSLCDVEAARLWPRGRFAFSLRGGTTVRLFQGVWTRWAIGFSLRGGTGGRVLVGGGAGVAPGGGWGLCWRGAGGLVG